MAHAVVLQVKLNDLPSAEGDQMLKEIVIPNAKAQSGFQRGIWMRTTDNDGLGVVVFDTEKNAETALSALKPPPGGPELLSITVYEVGAEA
jgi:hypothetical protein